MDNKEVNDTMSTKATDKNNPKHSPSRSNKPSDQGKPNEQK